MICVEILLQLQLNMLLRFSSLKKNMSITINKIVIILNIKIIAKEKVTNYIHRIIFYYVHPNLNICQIFKCKSNVENIDKFKMVK